MEETISSQDAPDLFDDLLRASRGRDRYVVERDGVSLVAVIPFALYSQLKRRRQSFADVNEKEDIPLDSVTARTAGALRAAGIRHTVAKERDAFQRAVADQNAAVTVPRTRLSSGDSLDVDCKSY